MNARCKALLVLVLASIIAAAQPPSSLESLAGYRLGETWSSIGRAMPCETDSLAPSWKVKIKRCLPNGSIVGLWFVRDTLYLISYVPHADEIGPVHPVDTLPADLLWSRRWKQWSTARYGTPDSVSMTTGRTIDTRQVTAVWHRGLRFAELQIISYPGGQQDYVAVSLCDGGFVRCRSTWLRLNGEER